MFGDITKQKQIAETVKLSEEKYRAIIENIEDGYFEIDLTGNLTFFNESLIKTSGYSQEELKSLNVLDYMDEENANNVFENLNNIFKTGKSLQNVKWKAIRKDGNTEGRGLY